MLRLHWLILAALLAPAAAIAQTNGAAPETTVGSPLLRDFQLKGTRTTPPAQEQPVAQPAPAEREPQVAQPDTGRSVRSAPSPVREARAAPQPATRQADAPAAAAPPANDAAVEAAFADMYPAPAAVPAATLPAAPALEQPLTQAAPSADYSMWIALGAGLLLLIGALAWFRSRRGIAEPALARVSMPEAAPAAEPVPVRLGPAPVPAAPPVDDALRPWLEIEFKPEKLVATDQDTSVHFQLLVKNEGQSAARNVRITAKMFNPSPDQKEAINAFFATPLAAKGEPVTIPPQLAARFKPSVVMPRESIKVLQVQGLPIFVPTVAINIQYEWGDGRKGQTCKSFLIGTEKEGADKMGAFRLDLGPRIYRQVGGRPLELARAL